MALHQWISVGISSLEKMQKLASTFCDKLSVLDRHNFVAKLQRALLNRIKENLEDSELENYSWISAQATSHPFVVYKEEKNQTCGCVVISDCLKHNTVAVYYFETKLVNFLKTFKKQKVSSNFLI